LRCFRPIWVENEFLSQRFKALFFQRPLVVGFRKSRWCFICSCWWHVVCSLFKKQQGRRHFKKNYKIKIDLTHELEGPRQGWIFKCPGPRVWDIYIFLLFYIRVKKIDKKSLNPIEFIRRVAGLTSKFATSKLFFFFSWMLLLPLIKKNYFLLLMMYFYHLGTALLS